MKSPTRSPPPCPPEATSDRAGAEGLKHLLESRGVMPTDYDDWRKIEENETGRARPGSPREKFVRPRTGSAFSAASSSPAARLGRGTIERN